MKRFCTLIVVAATALLMTAVVNAQAPPPGPGDPTMIQTEHVYESTTLHTEYIDLVMANAWAEAETELQNPLFEGTLIALGIFHQSDLVTDGLEYQAELWEAANPGWMRIITPLPVDLHPHWANEFSQLNHTPDQTTYEDPYLSVWVRTIHPYLKTDIWIGN